jgi:septum formation protein
LIVLASASAVRAKMLREAGVAFAVVSSGLDEEPIKARMLAAGVGPREVAERLAEAKALAAQAAPDDLVIGADQTLDLDGELVDKATNLDEARARLERLRGRRHTLHAAAALARGGEIVWRGRASPVLAMRAFTDAFLDQYLSDCGEASLGSVGCYHLEGRGAQLFDAVEGDYFAVLGLPLLDVLSALRQAGALAS